MFWFFRKCVQKFGLQGIRVYLNIKIFRSGKTRLPGIPGPLYFRPNRSDEHTFREIFLREEYNIAVPEGFNPRMIIDAGANIGFTTLFYKRKFSNVKILSLEPDKENFDLLKKNTECYPDITSIQCALWNKTGHIELNDEGYGLRGYIASTEKKPTSVSVPAVTLPDLLEKYQIDIIDILKIDIEGSEIEVFSFQPDQWLPRTRCVIVELHDRMREASSRTVFREMSKHNFAFSIKGENLVFWNRELSC